MAKTIARPPASGLYEEDFPLWAERQAAMLRARRFDELDLENLIEEVEDLSRRERDTVESHVETILEHLLKLELSNAARPRRGWLVTIDKQRAKLARKLTTTLRNHLEAELPTLYAGLRRPVARQLEKDGVSQDALPAACSYTLDQILDPDWFPNNMHGIKDPAP
jgi:ABC-type phosphate transport system auxiliary subunit